MAARSGWSGAQGLGAPLPASHEPLKPQEPEDPSDENGGRPPVIIMPVAEFSARVLAGYLQHYQAKHGYPTTLREICHHFRRSEKTIQALLGVAVEMGLVVADQSGQHRRHRIAV